MQQETIFDHQASTNEKIYKDREVWVGTLIGGPLVAGYMIARNFKVFGEPDKARNTWIITALFTVGVFYMALFAPYLDRVPNTLFGLVYAGITIVLVRLYQGEKIIEHIRAGRQIHSWWQTLGVALLGIVITLILYAGAAYWFVYSNMAVKNYGAVRHEVNYDKPNITESEVDAVAAGLEKINVFNDQAKWYVYVQKVKSDYEITFGVNKTILQSPQDLDYFRNNRDKMQELFPNNKIVFKLAADDLDNPFKRFE